MIPMENQRANRELGMADERMLDMVRLLEQRYGRTDWDQYRSSWSGLVQFVLERAVSGKKFPKAWAALEESWLLSAEDVAQASKSDLFELVEPYGISAEIVALLHRLAIWWQREIDAGCTPFQGSRSELESQWEELSIRDANWITRIFCGLGGLNKFPMSRGIWRIACRHGWLSWHDEPDELSSFYGQLAINQGLEPGQLAEWIIQTGDDYCKARAKCVGCPLESILGPSGPCEPPE